MEMHANVYIVSHSHLAKYKVCYVEHAFQERNAHLLSGGTLVEHEHLANVKVYIVKHAPQADILITPDHFPKPGIAR